MKFDPDLPVLLVPLVALILVSVHMWRRWRGTWRFAAAIPLVSVVVNLVVIRPFWSGGKEWSGYEAAIRYALVLSVEFVAIAIVALIHAALRARSQEGKQP